VANSSYANHKQPKWTYTAELDERFHQETAMVLELSRQVEGDDIVAACIDAKQLSVEQESLAEALAWSYEHGDVKKVVYFDQSGRYDDMTFGKVADEADSRLFEPTLPRGFSNLDDSQEATTLGGAEVVHLPPLQRALPSRKASKRYGVLSGKRNKKSDSRPHEEGSPRKGGLVPKVHSTKSRMNRMFRDWTPIIGPDFSRAGSVLSDLFGRSSDLSVDLAEFENMADAPWEDKIDREDTADTPTIRLENSDFSHESEMAAMPKLECNEIVDVDTITEVHSQSRQYDDSVTFSF